MGTKFTFAVLLCTALLTGTAAAADEKPLIFCIFDPVGANGDFYKVAADWQVAAAEWGVKIKMRVHTDEKIASEELRAGHCDAALLTGTRARTFNKFSGTIEAIGALPSYDHLGDVIRLLGNPKAGKRMRRGAFETLAVFPAGALHLVVHDRSMASVEGLAGKCMATFDYDKASMAVVKLVGAALVPAEVSTFAGMFKNHAVDVCYAPVTALKPLEILPALKKKGAVVRLPLAQITTQIIARTGAGWPEGFGDRSRKWAAGHFRTAVSLPKKAAAEVPAALWVETPQADRIRYDGIFRQARISLRDEGVYDPVMLKLLRRIRCKRAPEAAECADKLE